jgi:hypothetical protein
MQAPLARTNSHRALAGSAHQLQRSAGALQAHASDGNAVPTHGITLAHVEEAIDRLAVAMGQMASAVAAWCGEPDAVVEETALPPEARALRRHVYALAENLRASEVACTVSREWTRRLLSAAAADDDAAPADQSA